MNMSIVRSADKKGVFIKLKHSDVNDGEYLYFYREGASQLEVELLQERLDKVVSAQLEGLRRTSYLRGWRAAKSKKIAKESWFAMCLDILNWEKVESGEEHP